MRFLLDANIPHSATSVFRAPHMALHVRDVGLSTASDDAVMAHAIRHRMAVVARDLDFGNILRYPPRRYHGIVILKVPTHYTAQEILRVLGDFLRSRPFPRVKGQTIIVEEGRLRIRE